MKILKILTSRIGAMSLSAGKTAGMAVTVGLIGLNIYNFSTSTEAAQEERVRSLSSIISAGGALPSEYSGINLDASGVQFATPEEIAAKEGTLFDGGEGAVKALDNLSISSYALGAGDAGLGMGANAATQVGAGGQAVTGNVSADGSAVGAAAAQQAQKTQINKLGEEKAGGLRRASIAKASGSSMGSSSSSSGFGASGGRGQSASVKSNGGVASEGYTLSGSMPKGSTLLASNSNVRGAASSSSSFMAGNTRTRIGQGISSKEGRSLRDIALASSKVAANANRASNDGAGPFMASEKLSGSIQIMGDEKSELLGGNSTDQFTEDLGKQEDALGQGIDEVDTTEQERITERTKLASLMFTLMFATIGSCLLISSLMKGGVWSKVAAVAIGVVMAALIIAYIVKCANYINKYHEETGWAIAGIVMGSLMLVAIGISYVNFSKGNQEAMTSTAGEQMGTGGAEATAEGTGAAAGKGGSGFGEFLGDMAKGGAPGAAFEAGGELLSGSGEEGTGQK